MPDGAVETAANRAIRAQMGLSGGQPVAQPQPQAQPQARPQGQPQGQPQGAPADPTVTADQMKAVQEQLSALKTALESTSSQATQQQSHIANLEGELSVLRGRAAEEALQLPKDEELDELPRSEAIRRCAEVIAEQKVRALDQKFLGAFSKMAQDVIMTKNATEEAQVKEMFPGVDIEKYRPVLEQKRTQFPSASTVDLVRLVADPKELAQEPDTTRETQDAVHMETGRGAGTGADSGGEGERNGITEDQLREGFVNARNAGSRLQAESYLLEMLKRRPDVQHVPREQGQAGG